VDPRGAAGIAKAAGAVRELPAATDRCADLLQARQTTTERLARLRDKVDGARLPDRSSLVLFGSWGRHELTSESDDDWGLLVDDPDLELDGPLVGQALEHLREVFEQHKAPGRQAYFGCAFHSRPLSKRIGLDEDDTRNLTRRMLLLLESVPATGADVHRLVQDRVLERYLERHRKDFRPPRFLLNDIIRYWRTICVDFEGKVAQDEREGVEKDKFVMRNAKLRTSRKMLYASGLLPVLLCHHLEAHDMSAFLRGQLDAPATDRVARAFLHLAQPDPGLRVMAAYSEWIRLVDAKENRDVLGRLDEASRHDSPVFAEVTRIGRLIDGGLIALLFEGRLSQIALRYVAL
jgi:Putative nucleotidyltransferase DUF294